MQHASLAKDAGPYSCVTMEQNVERLCSLTPGQAGPNLGYKRPQLNLLSNISIKIVLRC